MERAGTSEEEMKPEQLTGRSFTNNDDDDDDDDDDDLQCWNGRTCWKYKQERQGKPIRLYFQHSSV
jgi:hypothetical protein